MANARQFVFYLGRIVVDVEISTERIALLDQRLLSQLAELQSMIGDSAQPWASVSPLFTNLAATWTSLQVGDQEKYANRDHCLIIWYDSDSVQASFPEV